MVRVQEPMLPALDAQFFDSFGNHDGSLEKFRADNARQPRRELKGNLLARLKGGGGGKARGCLSSIDLPQGMVERVTRALAAQAEAQAQQQGQKDAKFIGRFLLTRRRRVAAGLLLSEVARQNQLRVDSRRVAGLRRRSPRDLRGARPVVELYKPRSPTHERPAKSRAGRPGGGWIADHARTTEAKQTFTEVMRPIA